MSILNNQQKMNEIIFANRNKRYGAYAMRSEYGATLLKSLSIIFFGFCCTLYCAYCFSNHPPSSPPGLSGLPLENDTVFTITVKVEPPEPQEAATQRLPKPAASLFSPALGTRISDTARTEASLLNSELAATGSSSVAQGFQGGETGTGAVSETLAGSGNKPEIDVFHIADKEPEFEGGLKALYSFLSSRLKYPSRAAEEGREGTVFVRFVVDQNGRIGQITLLNNLGYGLDEEALRVAAMIPDFKSPGSVNGKPVKVYFQLPVKFSLKR